MKSNKYLELQKQIAQKFGMPPTEATILATIKSSSHPISLDEVSQKTRYSLATISNAVKLFSMRNLICKSKQPGSRKVFVNAKRDYLNVMVKKLTVVYDTTSIIISELPEIISSSSDPEEIKQRKEELRQAKISNKVLSETLTKLKGLTK